LSALLGEDFCLLPFVTLMHTKKQENALSNLARDSSFDLHRGTADSLQNDSHLSLTFPEMTMKVQHIYAPQ
jgi:hypothetical protein